MGSITVPFVKLEVTFVDDPLCRISLALYVAGCKRRCPGCHNPQLQDPKNGKPEELETIQQMANPILLSGVVASVVFLGGDWAMYPEAYVQMARWARKKKLGTVLYTGDRIENLPQDVCDASDFIKDGPYVKELPSVYPPSSNQRVFLHGEPVKVEELPLYLHLLRNGPRGTTRED